MSFFLKEEDSVSRSKNIPGNKINQLIHEISLVFVVGTTITIIHVRVNGQLQPESDYSFFLVLKLE